MLPEKIRCSNGGFALTHNHAITRRSPLQTFEEAIHEVKVLRQFASSALNEFRHRSSVFSATKRLFLTSGGSLLNGDVAGRDGRREAVRCEATSMLTEYKRKLVEKPDDVKEILYLAVKANVLFSHASPNEIDHVVDVFQREVVPEGTKIIEQGDEGTNFYVIEKGSFDVYIKAVGDKNPTKIEGASITDGESFGELSLMYSKPRAATIVATEESVLWSLNRSDYHTIRTYFHSQRIINNIRIKNNTSVIIPNLGGPFG